MFKPFYIVAVTTVMPIGWVNREFYLHYYSGGYWLEEKWNDTSSVKGSFNQEKMIDFFYETFMTPEGLNRRNDIIAHAFRVINNALGFSPEYHIKPKLHFSIKKIDMIETLYFDYVE